ncbi:hypothetical protein FA13DRAFT_1305696 [Coprinellus micaceus]|uniref:Uncharacterized protein n=1 Tax=Coprinellus micaceus TaxID=71717 RepID=A0A4Y7SS71_COPMI|nr:hypothetical protein FA13DRAFT_1305696 [Coprinellus micaceus]
MYNSFSTGQVAQLETSPPRGIDEEASKERRACGKSGRCGSPPKSQTGRRSSGWSLARDTGAFQPLPSPEGAPLKTGWYHIRSLGGRGLTVRKVEKDGVYPQPLFVDYVDKRGSGSELGDSLTDGPGQWAVSDNGQDGEIGLKLLGGNPCVVKLDDGSEFIGLDDFGQYSSPEVQWKLAEASGDFKYQNSSGEALRVYRYADSATSLSQQLNEEMCLGL